MRRLLMENSKIFVIPDLNTRSIIPVLIELSSLVGRALISFFRILDYFLLIATLISVFVSILA